MVTTWEDYIQNGRSQKARMGQIGIKKIFYFPHRVSHFGAYVLFSYTSLHLNMNDDPFFYCKTLISAVRIINMN